MVDYIRFDDVRFARVNMWHSVLYTYIIHSVYTVPYNCTRKSLSKDSQILLGGLSTVGRHVQ